jgi:hypothetical protein
MPVGRKTMEGFLTQLYHDPEEILPNSEWMSPLREENDEDMWDSVIVDEDDGYAD